MKSIEALISHAITYLLRQQNVCKMCDIIYHSRKAGNQKEFLGNIVEISEQYNIQRNKIRSADRSMRISRKNILYSRLIFNTFASSLHTSRYHHIRVSRFIAKLFYNALLDCIGAQDFSNKIYCRSTYSTICITSLD